MSEHRDKIKGGLADKKKPSDFNSKSLAQGIKVEMEHTKDKSIAKEIAMDHLKEDKDYYKKLKDIEKKDLIEVTPDGKREIVEGKEPLKKEPKGRKQVHPKDPVLNYDKTGPRALSDEQRERYEKRVMALNERWKNLKKNLDNSAILDLRSEMQDEDEQAAMMQQMIQGQPGEDQQEGGALIDEAQLQELLSGDETEGDTDETEELENMEGDPGSSREDLPNQEQLDEADMSDGDLQDDEQYEDEGEEIPEEDMQDDLEVGDAEDEQMPEELEGEDQEIPEEGMGELEEEPQQDGKQAEEDDWSSIEKELVESLREEGYSDPEIAYIVHGHLAPDISEVDAAKAAATKAMSAVDVESAKKESELNTQMKLKQMELEHQHAKRMKDLEYEHARLQSPDPEIDKNHKKRMLDLEYENAKARSPDGFEKDVKKRMAEIELEQRKLELDRRKQEIQIELEFKKKELELKIKHAEEMAKKKLMAKDSLDKKPLKKSEETLHEQD